MERKWNENEKHKSNDWKNRNINDTTDRCDDYDNKNKVNVANKHSKFIGSSKNKTNGPATFSR